MYSAFAPLIQGIDQRLYVLLPVNEHHLSRLVREWRDSWGKGPPRNAHQLISLTDFADQYDLTLSDLLRLSEAGRLPDRIPVNGIWLERSAVEAWE